MSRATHLRSAAALVALSGLGAVTGCASTSAAPAFDEVSKTVKAQGGHELRWDATSTESVELARAIDGLLTREVTVDVAVQVALLASPSLRATLEELSISRADLVQAGLLKNPVFGIGKTAWESEHIAPNIFATVEQDFLDILTMPMRKRVAATELEATKLAVGDAVLKHAAEVRSAFFTAQAAAQIVIMRRLVDDAAQTSAELAQRQYDAGNMNDLAIQSELALASQTRLDLQHAKSEAAVAREELNKRMGLWGPRTRWKMAARLPELPREEVSLARLESMAVNKRLDIGAARREVQALDYALSLATTTRWTGMVNVSVEAGRLRDKKAFSFGPSVALEIPLFDQRQAAIARLEAYKRQAENNLRSLAVDARADVRANKARLTAARAVVDEYRTVFVPVRERIVKFSQQQYDAMLLGVYHLIQAKRSEYEAYRAYIEALRDYWIARSDLERVVGVRLVTAPPAQGLPSRPTPSSGAAHSPMSPKPTAPAGHQH